VCRNVLALLRIPVQYWPPEAPQLLDSLVAYIRELPVSERTSAAALDALQLADNLAALLPLDQAKKFHGDEIKKYRDIITKAGIAQIE